MSENAKWEERFARPGYWAGSEPAPVVREILPLLPGPGAALELAMGEGRNAVFLAQQGWRVTGVEQAAAGLEKTAALAQTRGVTTWRGEGLQHAVAPGVLLVQGDLEKELVPGAQYDLVLVINFMLRSLLPRLADMVAPGGHILYETYTIHQMDRAGGPKCADYLLRPGELRAAFAEMEVLVYREWAAGKGVASLLARRQANWTARRAAVLQGSR